jgi:hypothetical protein
MDRFAPILSAISAGKKFFEPKDDSPAAIERFQPEAALLLEARKAGLVEFLNEPLRNADSAGQSYLCIAVARLTSRGRQLLGQMNLDQHGDNTPCTERR